MSAEKKKEELKETDYSALSALLDFHSDRAVAHASFLVACVFGLVTILSLIRGVEPILKIVYSLTYWFLWFAGLYSLLNFGFYSSRAEVIHTFIRIHKNSLMNRIKEIEEIKEKREKEKKERSISYRTTRNGYHWFKNLDGKLNIMITIYFIFIGILPWLFTCPF